MEDRTEVEWLTTDFEPGDVVFLGLDTLHMTAANATDELRISCDTRWRHAGGEPDPRTGPRRVL